jgi:hypothetical protein
MVVSSQKNTYWYNDRIGELFEVKEKYFKIDGKYYYDDHFSGTRFVLHDDISEYYCHWYEVVYPERNGYINLSDCKIIKEF